LKENLSTARKGLMSFPGIRPGKDMDLKMKTGGVQGFLGIQGFTRYGLAANRGELLYFQVSPVNIAVLSKSVMELKIRQLMLVLSALPGMEILCLDSHACFDRNQAYMKEQMEQEENPAVRLLLQKDREHLDSIQSELAADRQFLFVLRVKNRTEEQVFQTVNRAEKAMADQGFEVRRLDKEGIKQQLQAYFDAGGQTLPDVDGAQWMEGR